MIGCSNTEINNMYTKWCCKVIVGEHNRFDCLYTRAHTLQVSMNQTKKTKKTQKILDFNTKPAMTNEEKHATNS